MKEKSTIPLIFFLLLTLFVTEAKAQLQDVTASSGGNFTGSFYSISYTVGEPVIKTLTGTNLVVSQGFQQPNLIVTAIDEVKNLSVTIQAYPNPVTDYLRLVTSERLAEGSTYQLFNMNGSRIEEKKLDATVTEINFEMLVSSTYFLKVTQNSKTVKTFKIIKK